MNQRHNEMMQMLQSMRPTTEVNTTQSKRSRATSKLTSQTTSSHARKKIIRETQAIVEYQPDLTTLESTNYDDDEPSQFYTQH